MAECSLLSLGMKYQSLNFLMCMNITGTDKKRVCVIGKLRKSYSLKNVQKLLVEYAAIKTA
jgi:hypothetical protein